MFYALVKKKKTEESHAEEFALPLESFGIKLMFIGCSVFYSIYPE